MGCLPDMPHDFPMKYPDNAGNMIHGRAPFEMFEDCSFYLYDDFRLSGRTDFTDFVNRDCSHLIVTIANLLEIGDLDGAKYRDFQNYLETIQVPIVIFGLGAQAQTKDLTDTNIAPEAIELMTYLGRRCEVVGVRGPFTKQVFEHFAGVQNTFVTGCPSFFQRPDRFRVLRDNISSRPKGRPAFSGTVLHDSMESRMLVDAIERETFLVEPVSTFNHQLYLDVSRGSGEAQIPWYLTSYMEGDAPRLSRPQVEAYYKTYYRLFRSTQAWYKFNEEVVSYTYGTRFHVNMASILSGKPALWITHDSRTEELTQFLHLPSIPLNLASTMSPTELLSGMNYDELFDNLHQLYANFNDYLSIFSLPGLELDF